ncbi:hypothetical protein PsYK624_143990 [Phanerochaete sordida]|uniref:Uncharacterized protein n=1 Tax=Phanerochaete sordida TaxID=48140 RepID=A0A9P3GML8_9APHY|nr:hypothetical protein PsYK624_143990 [Phanerochaete sordida]
MPTAASAVCCIRRDLCLGRPPFPLQKSAACRRAPMANPPSPTYSTFSALSGAPPSYHSVEPNSRPASPASTIRTERDATAPVTDSYSLLASSLSQTTLSSTSELRFNDALLLPPIVQFGLRYSFSQDSPNSMQLLPPPEAPDSRSLYHISVRMNVFKPGSHISVVRRGATEFGPFVGEFEHGPHDRVNRVVMGDAVAKPFKDVVMFKRRYMRSSNLDWNGLKWTYGSLIIHWEPETQILERPTIRRILRFKCVTKDLKDKRVLAHLATFYPTNLLAARGGATPMPTLTFEQPGIELIDHIILSILVLQRQDYPQFTSSD